MIKQSSLVRTTHYSLTRTDLLAMLRAAVPGIILPEDTEVANGDGRVLAADETVVIQMSVKSVLEG